MGLHTLDDRDLVLEAVSEDLGEKRQVINELEKLVGDHVILATTTSSLPVTEVAAGSRVPTRIVGIHFFNPVQVTRLVEIIPTLLTAPGVIRAAELFATEALRKQAVRVTDRAGFLVYSLLVPMLLSAVRMLDSGIASAAEIDDALVLGFDHPMGPLRQCDVIGVDVVLAVAERLYAEVGDPSYAPPPLLKRMRTAGVLGRKSGAGFFDYSS